jgi:hypothetical protein
VLQPNSRAHADRYRTFVPKWLLPQAPWEELNNGYTTSEMLSSELFGLAQRLSYSGAQLAVWWFPERRVAVEILWRSDRWNLDKLFDGEREYLEQHLEGLSGAELTRRYLLWGAVVRDQLSQTQKLVEKAQTLMLRIHFSPTARILPRCLMGCSKWRDSDEARTLRRWSWKTDSKDFFEWRDVIVEAELFIDELESFVRSLYIYNAVIQPQVIPQQGMPLRQRSAYTFDDA